MENIDSKKYLNTTEVGALISRTPGAVRNLVLRQKIPYRKPAGRLMFIKSEIEDWVENAPGMTIKEINGS